MKVSIITVCFNAEEFIESCIKSVISQDYNDIEYIIIDGNSTDTTLQIINSYKKNISKIISEKDKGIYDALNKGIKLATGDVIGFLHADDFFASNNVLSTIVSTFIKFKAHIVYGNLDYVDRENPSKIIRKWRSQEFNEKLILFGWMPAHPTVYIKKEIYKEHGLFDTNYKYAADYDLLIRFFYKTNFIKKYLSEVIIKMRVGGLSNSSLKNRWFANREDFNVLKKNKVPFAKWIAFIKPVRKIFQFIN